MGMVKSDNDAIFFEAYANHFQKIFLKFLEDIPKIVKEFGDVNFIIRPHPAENKDAWLKILNGAKNLQIMDCQLLETT